MSEQYQKQKKKSILEVPEAKDLIVAVDGGHINTTEEGKRSMEEMTSVVYKPESIESNKKKSRTYLTSKNCAASVKNDNQEEMISGTIVAALKQGLTSNTHIHALFSYCRRQWVHG